MASFKHIIITLGDYYIKSGNKFITMKKLAELERETVKRMNSPLLTYRHLFEKRRIKPTEYDESRVEVRLNANGFKYYESLLSRYDPITDTTLIKKEFIRCKPDDINILKEVN